MANKVNKFTREQAALLIDLAVTMLEDGPESKHRALWYLRRSIPDVLPCWIQSQAPIKSWTDADLITTARLILDGGTFDEGLTCEEIAQLEKEEE